MSIKHLLVKIMQQSDEQIDHILLLYENIIEQYADLSKLLLQSLCQFRNCDAYERALENIEKQEEKLHD